MLKQTCQLIEKKLTLRSVSDAKCCAANQYLSFFRVNWPNLVVDCTFKIRLPKWRVDPISLLPTCLFLQVKSSFDRISTMSISPDRGQGPKELPVGIIHIAIHGKWKENIFKWLNATIKRSQPARTGPNPIATRHFSAYFYRAVCKTERIDCTHSCRLDWIDDVFSGMSDDGWHSKKATERGYRRHVVTQRRVHAQRWINKNILKKKMYK